MLDIYIDADACPVKEETYKVARRHELMVYVVAGGRIKVPFEEKIRAVAAGDGFDAADDWIIQRITEDDIAITTDLLLAERCIRLGARVLTPKGHEHNSASISSALATREILETLRQMGEMGSGPPPMTQRDRSNFLSALHELVERVRREY